MRRIILLSVLVSAVWGLSGCGGGADPASSNADAALPNNAAPALAVPATQNLTVLDLVPLLTRYGVGPGESGIDLIYAPDMFFTVTGLAPPAEAQSQPSLVFILQETIHEGTLLDASPAVYMELAGGDRVSPYDAQVTAQDPHHRTTRLLFAPPAGWATAPLATESGETLRLVVPLDDGTVSAGNSFQWRLPIDIGSAADHDAKE